MDTKDKIYWHDAHHEALQLELYQYKDVLEFKKELQLSKEALRMDTLVIKKLKNVKINKNIGKIFRNHNIVEYKSEQDSFDFWDFQKVLGYAHIYSSFEKVDMSEITVSLSLTIYPREFIKTLENRHGFTVTNFANGIYHIYGGVVPFQILESKNLPESENLFLRNLRSNLNKLDMYKTMQAYKERKPLNDKNVFLDRLVNANPNAFKEALGMFTETNRGIIMEAIEENGWLDGRETKRLKEVAKKMLLRGTSVEIVAEDTGLSLNTVAEIANTLP